MENTARRETITLSLGAAGWLARSDDPRVLALFGTDTLPVAYGASTSAVVVLDEIRRLNPSAIVVLAR
jgi:hypothetical protein